MPADFLAVPYKETGFLNVADAIDRYLKSNVSKAVLRSRRAILQSLPTSTPNSTPTPTPHPSPTFLANPPAAVSPRNRLLGGTL